MANDLHSPAFAMNARLGRGVNLGNALEAPAEGQWGVTLREEYFRLIRQMGFDSVRIPIRWSAHALPGEPFTVDAGFFRRIDWAVEQALHNDLLVVVNMHHYVEANQDPAGHRARYLAIWEQVARRYQSYPDTLLFELFNEPNGSTLAGDAWIDMAGAGLAKVREVSPGRVVILGGESWNSIGGLERFRLPQADPAVIATFHYYSPFRFTHQGAGWAQGSEQWLGTAWNGTDAEIDEIAQDFDRAQRWAGQNSCPLYLGEFGAFYRADMPSRARWTAEVARQAELRGFSWAYWEFCAGFGIYDSERNTFFQPLVDALVPG